MSWLSGFLLVAMMLFTSNMVMAASHYVTNADDAGVGSYHQAILDANSDSDEVVIYFNADLLIYLDASIVYTNTQAITLDGNNSIIDGAGAYQILNASDASSITINDLTLQNAYYNGDGGAIYTSGANIVINNSHFDGNTAEGGGGAIYSSRGAITISNSVFSHNSSDDGGAISNSRGSYTITDSIFNDNYSGGDGGALYSAWKSYSIDNSIFSNNSSDGDGGALYTGWGSYTITNSTFNGNTAKEEGGASRTSRGSYTITNSTFSNNRADEKGGALHASTGSITLNYVTLADNTALDSANLYYGDTLISYGSVIANPLGGGNNCGTGSGSSLSNGFNYVTDASCVLMGTGDTENGVDPQLEVLASTDGATPTRRPAMGSPLLDAIPDYNCDVSIVEDQRGRTRPQDNNNSGTFECDIGAVERSLVIQASVSSYTSLLLLTLLLAVTGLLSKALPKSIKFPTS